MTYLTQALCWGELMELGVVVPGHSAKDLVRIDVIGLGRWLFRLWLLGWLCTSTIALWMTIGWTGGAVIIWCRWRAANWVQRQVRAVCCSLAEWVVAFAGADGPFGVPRRRRAINEWWLGLWCWLKTIHLLACCWCFSNILLCLQFITYQVHLTHLCIQRLVIIRGLSWVIVLNWVYEIHMIRVRAG